MTFYHTSKDTKSPLSVPVEMAYKVPAIEESRSRDSVCQQSYSTARFDMEFMGLPPMPQTKVSERKAPERKVQTLDWFL